MKYINVQTPHTNQYTIIFYTQITKDEIIECSDWFSDYKSASSVERVEAFIKLGRKDPVGYADETGPVNWEHVVNEVTKVLETHNN
jgi:7-cyano-7-deazaguanine synthase